MDTRHRRLVALALLMLLLASCGRSGSVGQAAPPTVVVTAPTSGQQFQAGEQVTIQVTVTDAQGVSRVEVGVDGILLQTLDNPSPAANAPFAVQQGWTADKPGSHAVMVVAYNTAGVASSPVVVNVTVVAAGEPVPSQPTGDSTPAGAEPTATWTPIAVSPGASPTTEPPAPPASTEAPPPPPPTATSEPPSDGGARPHHRL